MSAKGRSGRSVIRIDCALWTARRAVGLLLTVDGEPTRSVDRTPLEPYGRSALT